MTIQSKFKDYYDHIGLRYGQDPQIVYERKERPVWSFDTPLGKLFPEIPSYKVPKRLRRPSTVEYPDFSVKYIVAATHVFPFITRQPLETETGPSRLVTIDEFKTELYDRLSKWEREEPLNHLFKPNAGVTESDLEDVIRLVKAPVFLLKPRNFHSVRGFDIDERCPILSEWGIPALVPAGQMWQDIYGVLQNVLRDSPDKAPPVEVSNESKIVKAGFDLKTSFRGK